MHVALRACRGRAIITGGLALTLMCVLIQHRGRVSGVKGSCVCGGGGARVCVVTLRRGGGSKHALR